MTKRMLIDGQHAEETRVVIADDDNLLEFDIESNSKKQTKGNLYLAKVTRVEPSLQAAFLEYGSERQGFLPFSEIHPDYYQIPVADKEALLKEYNIQQQEEADEDDEGDKEASGEDSDKETDEAIEDLGSDVPFEEPQRRPKPRRYKIQEVVKKNQVILIQVIKEERGNKGASVTTYISIPGRYCVLMPNSTKGGGVSRKISDGKERKRLKSALEGISLNEGMNLIVRTAGMGRTKVEISRDYNYLFKLWNEIRKQTLSSVAPSLIYEEANAVKRSLRDLYNNEIEEVIVAGEECHKMAKDFMKLIMPSHSKKIELYDGQTPIFNKFDIERHLASMYNPIVMMPSGGYLVINSTEALISVDVNSGSSTRERNVEDMATSTNIEAAEEVARQLRLRDLSGLIVIDFIDMLRVGHRRQVERALKDALKSDRAKIQVGRISPFGLLEMSRQRLRPSLTEINMIECPSCKGVGIIRSSDSASVQLIRTIENQIAEKEAKIKKITVSVCEELALHFLNSKRRRISEIENEHGFELIVQTEAMAPDAFKIKLEDERGKTDNISSDDRGDLRLPHSRDNRKGKRNNKRGGKQNRNRDRDRKRDDYKSNDEDKSSGEKPQEPDSKEESVNDEDKKPATKGRGRKPALKKPSRAKKSDADSIKPEAVKEEKSEKPVPKKRGRKKVEKKEPADTPANATEANGNEKSEPKQTKGWWKKIVD